MGFKSDWWARLGSAFNHYGAFPIAARAEPTPQAIGAQVGRQQRVNGMASGFPCLLANASCGGALGSMANLYKAIGERIGKQTSSRG